MKGRTCVERVKRLLVARVMECESFGVDRNVREAAGINFLYFSSKSNKKHAKKVSNEELRL